MKKMKKGFTLVELIVALAIFVILFVALYDLYMKNFSMYRDNQKKSKVEIQVKNFSDSIYNYLKASYQDSIEVGTKGKFTNLEWESEDGKSGVIGEHDILFMVIPKKDNPVKYEFKGDIRLIPSEVTDERYSYEYGALSKIASGEKFEELTSEYNYVMIRKQDDYIETISNITGEETTTKSLEGIIKDFTIKPKYKEVVTNVHELDSIEITLEYINDKDKPSKISYTIRK